MTLKELDKKLMWFFTMHNYPKRVKTPLSRFIFAVGVHLLIGAMLISADLFEGRLDWFSYIIVMGFVLAISYHYRLWRQEKRIEPDGLTGAGVS